MVSHLGQNGQPFRAVWLTILGSARDGDNSADRRNGVATATKALPSKSAFLRALTESMEMVIGTIVAAFIRAVTIGRFWPGETCSISTGREYDLPKKDRRR